MFILQHNDYGAFIRLFVVNKMKTVLSIDEL